MAVKHQDSYKNDYPASNTVFNSSVQNSNLTKYLSAKCKTGNAYTCVHIRTHVFIHTYINTLHVHASPPLQACSLFKIKNIPTSRNQTPTSKTKKKNQQPIKKTPNTKNQKHPNQKQKHPNQTKTPTPPKNPKHINGYPPRTITMQDNDSVQLFLQYIHMKRK